jgi:hypothetical protein
VWTSLLQYPLVLGSQLGRSMCTLRHPSAYLGLQPIPAFFRPCALRSRCCVSLLSNVTVPASFRAVALLHSWLLFGTVHTDAVHMKLLIVLPASHQFITEKQKINIMAMFCSVFVTVAAFRSRLHSFGSTRQGFSP